MSNVRLAFALANLINWLENHKQTKDDGKFHINDSVQCSSVPVSNGSFVLLQQHKMRSEKYVYRINTITYKDREGMLLNAGREIPVFH